MVEIDEEGRRKKRWDDNHLYTLRVHVIECALTLAWEHVNISAFRVILKAHRLSRVPNVVTGKLAKLAKVSFITNPGHCSL